MTHHRPLRRGGHVVDVCGMALRYHVRGTGGPVCVVLPGGPGLSWEYLRAPALELGLTVVHVEPLGSGESGRLPTHPYGYDRAFHARALDRLLDHLGQDQVYLLGHGHGGRVAQYYALRRPARLAGLILHGSSPVGGAELEEETRHQFDRFIRRNQANPALPAVIDAARLLPTITDERLLTAAARRMFPALVAHYWGRREELSPLRAKIRFSYVSSRRADGTADPIDDRQPLRSLRVPTLVVAGSYDIAGGLRWGRELQSLIPNARLLVLPWSGHLGHVEEPERFAEAVTGFVTATRPALLRDDVLAA
ncbi:alpha/beta fold hydrolase [Paractinoplanes maris]|uniref:alpha/beta fold hydrolase n=1 Tax=Paractinoplanes maris TaxID=1734446 RepID=UPI002020B2CA|nr:alpha/beta hydrolase [Actinoplanes maris]